MTFTISNCPIPFHDAQELVQFLLHCGKWIWLFDGQNILHDGRYLCTFRVRWSQRTFCELLTYEIRRQ